MYVLWNLVDPNKGSVGAIKMLVDSDEHTLHNGTQSPNAVHQSDIWETAVNHKMLSSVSILSIYFKVLDLSLGSVWLVQTLQVS